MTFLLRSSSTWTKRHFSTYSHFDTFKFVERLEKEKFTRQQSEAIMISLQKVIAETMQDLKEPMVSKAEKEKVKEFVYMNVYSYIHTYISLNL